MPASRWWEKLGGGAGHGSPGAPTSGLSVYGDRAPAPSDDDGESWVPVGELDWGTGRFTPSPEWRGSADGWRPLEEFLRARGRW
jgi:hypothetical protein